MNLEPIREMASIEEVLEFCNKVRQAGGGELLEDLLPSFPARSDSCLIARALNFSCCVGTAGTYPNEVGDDGLPESKWVMIFRKDQEELARRIAAAVDCSLIETTLGSFEMLLPQRIGRVANEFDRWADKIWEAAEYVKAEGAGIGKELVSEAELEAWKKSPFAPYLDPSVILPETRKDEEA